MVVSSVPPISAAELSPPRACAVTSRSAPSSSVICGRRGRRAAPARARRRCRVLSPRRARTSTPSASTSAAATSSWVDSGLAEHSATLGAAGAAASAIRFAVSAVTCRQAAIRSPSSGRSAANRSRIWARTGICPAAQAIRASPSPASDEVGDVVRSGTDARAIARPPPRRRGPADLVAVVVGLVRAVDRRRRGSRPASSVSSVSCTPSASRCRRATFSSRCLGST